MGTPPAGAGPLTINFKRQLAFRTGSVGIEITSTKEPAVMLAIVGDNAVPGTDDILLGNMALNAKAGKDLTFATDRGNVSFRAQAAASSGLGGYFTPANLLTDFPVAEELSFSLPDNPCSYSMLFHYYDRRRAWAHRFGGGSPRHGSSNH